MTDEEMKAFYEAVKKGIEKGLEKVDPKDVDWFNIKLQK